MKKILVTGASGFFGCRIVDFYNGKYEICAPTHDEMDITNKESVMNFFEKNTPDIVIHCAAISDIDVCDKQPEKSWKINVDGSVNIAKASEQIQAKCILCSSDQVYFGSSVTTAHKEDEELEPFNLYGREKLKAEEECLKANPDCVLLRLSWMYDTRTMKEAEHGDFIKDVLSKLKSADVLRYPVYDKRGITDVNEVIKNLEKAFEIPGGVYNFGAPNDKDFFSTVYEVFTKVGVDTKRLKKNEEAFVENTRNISMSQEKLNKYGIFFSTTAEGLIRNLSKY